MSVEAVSWALDLAPVPAARAGQPPAACKFVLAGLASHAGPDGTGAFPSVATLVRCTGLSEPTVRTCPDRLDAAGIIRLCDPEIVAARIKRAGRRPNGWDLDLSLIRDDLTEAGLAAPGHQFPGLAARVAAAACPDAGGAADGLHSPHPAGTAENRPGGAQPLHPASGTGCSERAGGVQPAQPPGAAVAPEPPTEPSAARARAGARRCSQRRAPPSAASGPGEFFETLGPAWRLTQAERARLTPAVLAALDDGWTPPGLAGFTGANTDGLRNPYAVLAARLPAAGLPPPAGPRAARPPWRGECDQNTPMPGFDVTPHVRARAASRPPQPAARSPNAIRPGLARANGTPHAQLPPSMRPVDAVRSPESAPADYVLLADDGFPVAGRHRTTGYGAPC